ncbi:hypothetical protein BZA77DRAFT_296730 [Pyronema omphalodes]|nr:hypothetical protein BZA77DRAFT_296730 [Pyronema omphalodes]
MTYHPGQWRLLSSGTLFIVIYVSDINNKFVSWIILAVYSSLISDGATSDENVPKPWFPNTPKSKCTTFLGLRAVLGVSNLPTTKNHKRVPAIWSRVLEDLQHSYRLKADTVKIFSAVALAW